MSLPVGALLSNSTIYYNHDHDICNITINVDDTTLCSKCDQASNLWQQQELPSKLEYGQPDTGLGQGVAC